MSSPNPKGSEEVLSIPKFIRRDGAYCRRFTLRQQGYSEDEIKAIELGIKLSKEISQISDKELSRGFVNKDFHRPMPLPVFRSL